MSTNLEDQNLPPSFIKKEQIPKGHWGTKHKCNFCNHEWKQRKKNGQVPKRCPDCGRPGWWLDNNQNGVNNEK